MNADGKKYINPGIPEARQHIIDTVMEVVKGYDIDGVHLDDYFYPSNVTFADDAAYSIYNTKSFLKLIGAEIILMNLSVSWENRFIR